MDCSLPGSSVHGILQARILEWAAVSISDIINSCTIVSAMLCLVAQSHPTLWDPLDCSPPDSSVNGDSQARILEWVAMPSSRGTF